MWSQTLAVFPASTEPLIEFPSRNNLRHVSLHASKGQANGSKCGLGEHHATPRLLHSFDKHRLIKHALVPTLHQGLCE